MRYAKVIIWLIILSFFLSSFSKIDIRAYSSTDAYDENLPEKYNYDVNQLKYVSSVKNQGNQGLCWAFASTACAESAVLKANLADEIDFSEYHLAHATSTDGGNTYAGTKSYYGPGFYTTTDRHYDEKGYFQLARDYWTCRQTGLSGLVLEENDPYKAYNPNPSFIYDSDAPIIDVGGLTTPPPMEEWSAEREVSETISAGIDSGYRVTRTVEAWEYPLKVSENENALKKIKTLVYRYGGCTAGIKMHQADTPYFTALYDDNEKREIDCTYYYPYPVAYENLNHMIQIVGWDDNFEANWISSNWHFDGEPLPDKGAFLCKNSWGTEFGEKGYFWVPYDNYIGAVNAVAEVRKTDDLLRGDFVRETYESMGETEIYSDSDGILHGEQLLSFLTYFHGYHGTKCKFYLDSDTEDHVPAKEVLLTENIKYDNGYEPIEYGYQILTLAEPVVLGQHFKFYVEVDEELANPHLLNDVDELYTESCVLTSGNATPSPTPTMSSTPPPISTNAPTLLPTISPTLLPTIQPSEKPEVTSQSISSMTRKPVKVGKVKNVRIRKRNNHSIRISWGKAKNAKKYEIAYSKKRSFAGKKIKATLKRKLVIKYLKKKTLYYYKVRGITIQNKKMIYGKWSNIVKKKY